jgi:hypothetical protein
MDQIKYLEKFFFVPIQFDNYRTHMRESIRQELEVKASV